MAKFEVVKLADLTAPTDPLIQRVNETYAIECARYKRALPTIKWQKRRGTTRYKSFMHFERNWARANGWIPVPYESSFTMDDGVIRYPYQNTAVDNPDSASGKCWPHGTIHINRSTSDDDTFAVSLHELAHHLVGCDHGHDSRFYNRCLELYRRYLPDDQFAAQSNRELKYKPRGYSAAASRV